MGADVLGQFIEACLCFCVGAYFGVKVAFTEIIGECSGKILKSILEITLGISYILLLYAAIFWLSDGNLKYYHFVIQLLGAAAVLPLARKLFRRYKRGIQRAWLWLLGKNDIPDAEPKKRRAKAYHEESEDGGRADSDTQAKVKRKERPARVKDNEDGGALDEEPVKKGRRRGAK